MKIFVTATDTNAGKTYIAAGLLRLAAARGLTSAGIKPVASGCSKINGKLVNDDALQLQQSATRKLAYDEVNPFAFAPAIAPHLAAQQRGITLDAATLHAHTSRTYADVHIIEGCGGWHTPLNSSESMADYAALLNADILLIVGLRLGCLNHAILTERAIATRGLRCLGWIANRVDADMEYQEENIATLQQWLQSPLLGCVHHQQPVEEALQHITIF